MGERWCGKVGEEKEKRGKGGGVGGEVRAGNKRVRGEEGGEVWGAEEEKGEELGREARGEEKEDGVAGLEAGREVEVVLAVFTLDPAVAFVLFHQQDRSEPEGLMGLEAA